MRLATLLVVSLVLLAGCADGGAEGGPKSTTKASRSAPENAEPRSFSTVQELKDAAIEAGYECPSWTQDNKVALAAESGHCSDADVFATFASEGDLQQQLETDREVDSLMEEAGIEADPSLIGSNWSIKGPGVDELSAALGGTVRR